MSLEDLTDLSAEENLKAEILASPIGYFLVGNYVWEGRNLEEPHFKKLLEEAKKESHTTWLDLETGEEVLQITEIDDAMGVIIGSSNAPRCETEADARALGNSDELGLADLYFSGDVIVHSPTRGFYIVNASKLEGFEKNESRPGYELIDAAAQKQFSSFSPGKKPPSVKALRIFSAELGREASALDGKVNFPGGSDIDQDVRILRARKGQAEDSLQLLSTKLVPGRAAKVQGQIDSTRRNIELLRARETGLKWQIALVNSVAGLVKAELS